MSGRFPDQTGTEEIKSIDREDSPRERLLLWVDRYLKWLLTLPTILILFSLTAFPLLRAIEMSFKSFSPTGEEYVGLMNFANLPQNANFVNSLSLTAKFILLAVGVELILGFTIALLLNKRLKFRGGIQTLILLPMLISPTIVGLTWRLLLTPDGLFDFFAKPFIGQNVGWISDPGVALFSIILADIWQWTPLVILVILAGLQSIPDDIREAAIMDGASRRQRFVHITLPHLKSLIVLVLIIRSVDALRVFAKVFILTRGGPSGATDVVSMFLFRVAFRFNNFGEAAAMSLTLLVIVIIASILFIKTAGVEF